MGDTAMILGVVKQATANPLDVSIALRKVLPNIRRDLPAGMNIDVSYDRSVFIEESIKNVYKTIAEAALLVAARKGGLDEHTLRALFPRRFPSRPRLSGRSWAGSGQP